MKIAIQGHPTRGKEVIQILESLGGKNTEKLKGTYNTFYYIDDKNEIGDDHKKNFPPTYKLYTLEEFEKEFPFKVGDEVLIPDYSNKKGTIINIDRCGPILSYFIKLETGNGIYRSTKSIKLYKEMKEERNITLILDKAKEWYKKGGELKEIALQAFTEMELNSLPRSWEEFCKNYSIKPEEICINGYSKFIVSNVGDRNSTHDKNICPSRKSAEAHFAMIQLEQLRNCWWGDWKFEWDDSYKYAIKNLQGKITILGCSNVSAFLVFPTSEIAEEFLKCFKDLIEKAKDLI